MMGKNLSRLRPRGNYIDQIKSTANAKEQMNNERSISTKKNLHMKNRIEKLKNLRKSMNVKEC